MLLSIIIVNFNTGQLIVDCLDSLFKFNQSKDFEIIIVDNHSPKGDVEIIQKKYHQIKLIKSPQNYGFGKANNMGTQIATGKYLLLLNSDTLFIDNSLDNLINKLNKSENNNEVWGIKLLNADKSLQPSMGYFPQISKIWAQMLFLDDLPILKNFFHSYHLNASNFYQKELEVDWITGAFILIPKPLFDEIGGFDESIFMYGEEVDLCFRFKKIGAKIKYLPQLQIIHLKGKASKNGLKAAVLGEYKGLLTFYHKHYSDKIKSLKKTLKIGALLRICLFAMIDKSKLEIYQKAFISIK